MISRDYFIELTAMQSLLFLNRLRGEERILRLHRPGSHGSTILRNDTRSDSCIKQTRASDIQIRTSEALAFQPYPAFVCWERFLYYIFTVIMSKA